MISVRRPGSVVATLLIASGSAGAAELHPETIQAWNRYVELTERRILEEITSNGAFLAQDFLDIDAARDCRERSLSGGYCILALETLESNGARIRVPNGLIHHWIGSVFVPGATLDRVLAWVQDYPSHANAFRDVEASETLARDGDRFEIFLRLKRKKIVTVHYNTEHTVTYRRLSPRRAYSRSVATKIAQIDNAGEPHERELPSGEDSGFLWRLNSYWRYEEIEGGVIVECESISLSRGIPAPVRWLVGRYVRSVPRESLEATLGGIRRGVHYRAFATSSCTTTPRSTSPACTPD